METKTYEPTAIPAAAVARLVRKELAQAFPGVKFEVSGTRSAWFEAEGELIVRWTDGPRSQTVEALIEKYQGIRLNRDPVSECWEKDIIGNDDETYYAVGSMHCQRTASAETLEAITAKVKVAMKSDSIEDIEFRFRANKADDAYRAFHKPDRFSVPALTRLSDFILWAFHQDDVASTAN